MTDASFVSSGVYERCFEVDGVRYHHLLSTSTGMPEENGLLSVSILFRDEDRFHALRREGRPIIFPLPLQSVFPSYTGVSYNRGDGYGWKREEALLFELFLLSVNRLCMEHKETRDIRPGRLCAVPHLRSFRASAKAVGVICTQL